MKKIVALLLVTVMAFSFIGCGEREVDPSVAGGKKGERVSYNYNMSDYVTLGKYLGIEIDTAGDTYKNYVNSYYTQLVANANAYNYIKEGILAKNDTTMIEYVGRIDGKEFQGGTSSEETALTLGSGSFIPGFEDALIGKSVGSTEVIKVTFPEDYDQTTYYTDDTEQKNGFNLKGQKAEFTVKINSKRELPEKNDETAKKMGFENNDALLNALKENAIEGIILDTVGSFAVKSFPETEKANYDELFNEIYTVAQQEATAYNAQYGTNIDAETMIYYMSGYTSDNLKYYYQNSQKLEIIMYAIFDAEKLTFTQQEYNDYLTEFAKQNSTSENTVTVEDIKAENKPWILEADMVRDVVIKHLVKSAVVK